MRRVLHRVVTLLVTGLLAASLGVPGPAGAASGSLSDPSGDDPDLVKLAYRNGARKVVITATYEGSFPPDEYFTMRSKTGLEYKVHSSKSDGVKELRQGLPTVACRRLSVTWSSKAHTTTVVVPRKCLKKATNKLRFRGLAMNGLDFDQTDWSRWVARG